MNSAHPYFTVKERVALIASRCGYQETEEHLQPDHFGSAYSIFQKDTKKLRYIWDGKDGWAVAQTEAPRKQWDDIPIYLTEADIEAAPQNEEKIKEFEAALYERLR
jgi:hypothetical protein